MVVGVNWKSVGPLLTQLSATQGTSPRINTTSGTLYRTHSLFAFLYAWIESTKIPWLNVSRTNYDEQDLSPSLNNLILFFHEQIKVSFFATAKRPPPHLIGPHEEMCVSKDNNRLFFCTALCEREESAQQTLECTHLNPP